MQTQIINGNKIKEDILAQIKSEVESLPLTPIFCDILVGSDLVSASYVRMKARVAESVGIKFRTAEFPESITTEALVEEIENLNRVPHMCGIIVQLPLPSHINKSMVLDAIAPTLDVDCLGSVNSQRFYDGEDGLKYPTALACMKVLESVNLNLSDKNVVMLGQGILVGKPVTHLLEEKGLKVMKVARGTENKNEIIKRLLKTVSVSI